MEKNWCSADQKCQYLTFGSVGGSGVIGEGGLGSGVIGSEGLGSGRSPMKRSMIIHITREAYGG